MIDPRHTTDLDWSQLAEAALTHDPADPILTQYAHPETAP